MTLPRKESVSTASPAPTAMSHARSLPPVLGRLLSGTFWLALRVPLQLVFALWTTRLVLEAIGTTSGGLPVRLGIRLLSVRCSNSGSARPAGGRSPTPGLVATPEQVDRAIACGMNFYTAMALVQMAALWGVAYGALPHTAYEGNSYDLVVKLLWLQIVTAPCYGFSVVVSSVLQAARRYDFVPRFEVMITILRFLVLYFGLKLGGRTFPEVASASHRSVAVGPWAEVGLTSSGWSWPR